METDPLSFLESAGLTPEDRARVEAAFALASRAHQGQTRDNGAPYIEHPAAVARLLVKEMRGIGPDLLCAALLHDALEESDVSPEEIARTCGGNAARLVQVLTRHAKTAPGTKPPFANYLARVAEAGTDAVTLKLADRACNLRDLRSSPKPGKKEKYLAETDDLLLPVLKTAVRPGPFEPGAATGIWLVERAVAEIRERDLFGPPEEGAPLGEGRKEELDERIRELRDPIQLLEDAKDAAAELYSGLQGLTPAARKIWTGDAAECYCSVVTAWTIVEGLTRETPPFSNAESAARLLRYARDASGRVESELAVLASPGAPPLLERWKAAFAAAHGGLARVLEDGTGKKEGPPARPAVRLAPAHYVLLCSVCGKKAASFSPNWDSCARKDAVQLAQLTVGASIGTADWEKVRAWLDGGKFLEVHRFLDRGFTEDGLDCYCPACDALYCRDHYDPVEIYDEGFYDHTMGTCPKGHTRELDD